MMLQNLYIILPKWCRYIVKILNEPLLKSSYQAAQTFYEVAQQAFFPAIQTANREVFHASLQKMRQAYEIHRAAIDDVVRLTTERNTLDEQDAKTSIFYYQMGLMSIFVFSIALAVLFTLLISRGILSELGGEPMHDKVGYGKHLAELINQLFGTTERSLNDVLRVAESLAKGDLTQTIDDDYVGAFAATKAGMNSTVENLKNLIGEIKATSER